MATNSKKLLNILSAMGMLALIASGHAHAAAEADSSIIGELQQITVSKNDSLPDIAKAFSIGLNEIELANQHLQRWVPGFGARVILPTKHILPDGKRQGIIINIPEMRIYYFQGGEVHTWPIGVGREGWNIPYKSGKIISRHKDPAWYPPESIRKEHAAEGDILPKVVPPGPENPLGEFALRMSLPGYLIHGTNKKYGIGMRVSHGCLRMYPHDIEELYNITPVGTNFNIINQPVKVGLREQRIYIEVHPHFVENSEPQGDVENYVQQRISALAAGRHVAMDWDLISSSISNPSGVPVAVGLIMGDYQANSLN